MIFDFLVKFAAAMGAASIVILGLVWLYVKGWGYKVSNHVYHKPFWRSVRVAEKGRMRLEKNGDITVMDGYTADVPPGGP